MPKRSEIPEKPRKIRIRLTRAEAVDVSRVAHVIAEKLIATHGSKQAVSIGRLIHEKIFASYKRLEGKYGKIDW